jgi:hypothetical protein
MSNMTVDTARSWAHRFSPADQPVLYLVVARNAAVVQPIKIIEARLFVLHMIRRLSLMRSSAATKLV